MSLNVGGAAANRPFEPAHGAERKRQRQQKPDEHDDELERVDDRRPQEPAGREIDRHDRAANERADPSRRSGEHVEDGGAGDELPRENRERADQRAAP